VFSLILIFIGPASIPIEAGGGGIGMDDFGARSGVAFMPKYT
jgi:hypothetical protein